MNLMYYKSKFVNHILEASYRVRGCVVLKKVEFGIIHDIIYKCFIQVEKNILVRLC